MPRNIGRLGRLERLLFEAVARSPDERAWLASWDGDLRGGWYSAPSEALFYMVSMAISKRSTSAIDPGRAFHDTCRRLYTLRSADFQWVRARLAQGDSAESIRAQLNAGFSRGGTELEESQFLELARSLIDVEELAPARTEEAG